MLIDLLMKRYSCRDFADRPIEKAIIDYMLECGRFSPSGGNEQPWKFGVITAPEMIREISDAAGVNYKQSWIASAPLLVVLCTQLFIFQNREIGMHRFPSLHDELQQIDRSLYERINMEEHQTKIPGEHMVLAALEHGICSTWISSVDCERVGRIIGIDDGYLVTNVIAFGYPNGEKQATPKKNLKSIVFSNRYCE